MDFASFTQRYYRFWNVEDLPTDNTFDKYQVPYFQEKQFDVEVRDGQLNIEFRGENWGCCVSAIVVYPLAKAAEGQRFLEFVQGPSTVPFRQLLQTRAAAARRIGWTRSPQEREAGLVVFSRDWMSDVFVSRSAAAWRARVEADGIGVCRRVRTGDVGRRAAARSGPRGGGVQRLGGARGRDDSRRGDRRRATCSTACPGSRWKGASIPLPRG